MSPSRSDDARQPDLQPDPEASMKRFRTRHLRAIPIAIALLIVSAIPAAAHPFVRGGEVPVDSLATLTLDLAHGCESEEAGAGLDTTDVALEVPAWLRIVEVPEPDGWTVELEAAPDDGNRVEVVTWTTTDAQEPAPAFDMDVVASGNVGDERYLGVFQGCGETSYRWVGTPDEPADDPAVRVVLTEPDPDAPAPPEPEPEPDPDTGDPIADDADAADPDAGDAAPDDVDEMDEPADESATAEAGSSADEAAIDQDEAAAAEEDGGIGGLAILLGIVLVAVLIGFVATRARGGTGHAPSDSAGTHG